MQHGALNEYPNPIPLLVLASLSSCWHASRQITELIACACKQGKKKNTSANLLYMWPCHHNTFMTGRSTFGEGRFVPLTTVNRVLSILCWSCEQQSALVRIKSRHKALKTLQAMNLSSRICCSCLSAWKTCSHTSSFSSRQVCPRSSVPGQATVYMCFFSPMGLTSLQEFWDINYIIWDVILYLQESNAWMSRAQSLCPWADFLSTKLQYTLYNSPIQVKIFMHQWKVNSCNRQSLTKSLVTV